MLTFVLAVISLFNLAAQQVRVYASDYSGIDYTHGPTGVISSLTSHGDGIIMITFADGGVFLEDGLYPKHFYPYVGESKDGKWTYCDSSMVNVGNSIIGVFARKGWGDIIVVYAHKTGLFYHESHYGYKFYGEGKDAINKYFSLHGQNASYNYAPSNNNSTRNSNTNPAIGTNRRTCLACGGTGKGTPEIIWAPQYTGSERYCSECGQVRPIHTHHHPICKACLGKGYIE